MKNDELRRQLEEAREAIRTLQEELAQTNEGMVALTFELEQRTAEVEAANRELESFSYSVSHDLRVPLRAIDGFTGIIIEEYLDRLDEEGKRLLVVVRDNTKKMTQLIEDLLAFSRLGRREMRRAVIDMEGLAREVGKELISLDSHRGGRTILFEVKPLPPAQGDPAMMRQIFVNLISNAIKFTRPRERTSITIEGSPGENECVYSVRDNGVGFNMAYKNKLFGIFQRLHGQEEFEGTGVGLSLVQRIVHRHGGRVWAESRINEGACFSFSLPRTK